MLVQGELGLNSEGSHAARASASSYGSSRARSSMNQQGSQEGSVRWQRICVSMQQCLADSGIDSAQQSRKLDFFAYKLPLPR